MKVITASFAPIAATPWQPHLKALESLLKKREPSMRVGVMIRSDGRKRALKLAFDAPDKPRPDDLVSYFQSTVIFFEQIRSVEPPIVQVFVETSGPGGAQTLIASKNDILDLFVDRIDAETFISRLTRLR